MASALTYIEEPAGDLVSSLHFSPHVASSFITTAWDGSLSLYNVETSHRGIESSKIAEVKPPSGAPLLCSAHDSFDAHVVYYGGVDQLVYVSNLDTNQSTALTAPSHIRPVSDMIHVEAISSLITTSWDQTMCYTDTRNNKLLARLQLPAKPYRVSTTGSSKPYIVVAMADRKVHIYDIRNLTAPSQVRESGLKYTTRDISCMPSGEGYAQSSIDGRVSVEFFDPTPAVQAQKYAFKCHRNTKNSEYDVVHPVNAIKFHPRYSSFFTAGSDGGVCLWDYKSRKRLKQYPKLPLAVTALDISKDGGLLAIATGDDSYKSRPDTSQIDKQAVESRLYIRQLQEDECKGKTD